MYSSLRYGVSMPVRTCMWKPPTPISCSTSICRSSSSRSSLQFHAQKGAPRYSDVGALNSSSVSRGASFFL